MVQPGSASRSSNRAFGRPACCPGPSSRVPRPNAQQALDVRSILRTAGRAFVGDEIVQPDDAHLEGADPHSLPSPVTRSKLDAVGGAKQIDPDRRHPHPDHLIVRRLPERVQHRSRRTKGGKSPRCTLDVRRARIDQEIEVFRGPWPVMKPDGVSAQQDVTDFGALEFREQIDEVGRKPERCLLHSSPGTAPRPRAGAGPGPAPARTRCRLPRRRAGALARRSTRPVSIEPALPESSPEG